MPLISASAHSPSLADGLDFPYFLRVSPSDEFLAAAIVDVMQYLFEFSSVAMASVTDTYGSGGARAFSTAVASTGLRISAAVTFRNDETRFDTQHQELLRSQAKVIVLFAQDNDAARFVRESYKAGIGGPGYLWMTGASTVHVDLNWNGAHDLRARSLKGSLSMVPDDRRASAEYDAFISRRRFIPGLNNAAGGRCTLETDTEGGTLLWGGDHDGDATSAVRCAGDSAQTAASYDSFGYDAVFAVAHALHDLIEVQNRTEIVGSELLDVLIKKVRFEGLTGLVDFYDASADPARMYHGDRRVGISYRLLNYVSADTPQAGIGVWSPCASSPCGWSERWQAFPNVSMVYSTADNSKPILTLECTYGEFLAFDGQCVCDAGFELGPTGRRCRRCDVGQSSQPA